MPPSLSQQAFRILALAVAFPVLCAGAPMYVGSRACEPCHAGIAASYRTTAMAHTSGVVEAIPHGGFIQKPARTQYVVDGIDVRSGGETRRLRYFIGSGAAGRSYAVARNGHLFLAPITWYTEAQRWDMSPGYQSARESLWNRPIEPNCLFCHSTRPQPIYGTQNRYADPPFAEAGIGCERCHGPGSDHVESGGAIVNPAKLPAAEREDVCAQCHLTGEARIDRPDRQLAMFRPGTKLAEYVSVFVAEGAGANRMRVTSHVEKLSHSVCRQKSGATLWCGTCHDAHRVPDAASRAAWYRGKCAGCHSRTLAAEHASRSDCVGCHMPRTKAADANHGVFTDHSIPRKPLGTTAGTKPPRAVRLTPFAGFASDERTLGLAYAEVALESNQETHQRQAQRLLRAALPNAMDDWNLLTRLAYLEEPERALAFYERSLKLRPQQPVALVNAGTVLAKQGRLAQAMEYWRRALAMNPGLTEASRNLAMALRAAGRGDEAEQVLRNAKWFAPGVDQ